MDYLITFGLFTVFFVLYMFPTFLTIYRDVDDIPSMNVAYVNVFMGWTVIGWFISLFMATHLVTNRDKG